MSEPYIGQVELFGFNFAPKGWALCAGQILPISTNQALFALLGTTYGGDGRTNFALPDLRGRVAVGQGNASGLPPATLGQAGGEETHTLTANETPAHNHALLTSPNANIAENTYTPAKNVTLTKTTGQDAGGNPLTFNIYAPDSSPSQVLAPDAVTTAGGQPHSNMMPYLGLNFCIALVGVFPSRD